jgi:hypothetical protein
MTTRIKLRRDTYQNWYDANPVLALGEAGYDITNNKLKIGDGVTAWRTLNYLADATGATQLQSDWTQSNNAALDFIKNKPAIPAPYASTSINALSDVDTVTSAPTNGQALVWNSAGSKWLPGTVAGGDSSTLVNGDFVVGLQPNGSLLLPTGDYQENESRYQGSILSENESSTIYMDVQTNSQGNVYGGMRLETWNSVPIDIRTRAGGQGDDIKNWRFGADGSITFPNDTVQTTAYTGDSSVSYKGFKAVYGRMYDSEPTISKVLIYQNTATPSSEVDVDTSSDLFQVSGLANSGVIALVNVYGADSTDPTALSTLQHFVKSIVDTVILNGGQEGNVNTVENMKTNFYDLFDNFASRAGDRYQNFYFNREEWLNISGTGGSGTGATFDLYRDRDDDTLDGVDTNQPGVNYQVNNVVTVLGTALGGTSPANDIVITVTQVGAGGQIQNCTATGTPPNNLFPLDNIEDGGSDQYDGANYIYTNIQGNSRAAPDVDNGEWALDYNSGNPAAGDAWFGTDSDYVVTYNDSIFGLFVTGANINWIATDGNSGFDGDGIADTGPLDMSNTDGLINGDQIFTLNSNGTVTFPDGTVQTTAYTEGDGNVWVQNFETMTGAPADIVAMANSVEYLDNGDIVALFSHLNDTSYFGGNRYNSIARFTPAGEKVWSMSFTGALATDGWGLAVDSNSIYVAGMDVGGGYDVATLTKLAQSDGEILWSKTYDVGYSNTNLVVDVGYDNNPVVVGYAYNGSDNQIVTTKIDSSNGSVIWSRALNGQNGEEAYGMAVGRNSDNEVVAVGWMDNLGIIDGAATLYADNNPNWTGGGLTAYSNGVNFTVSVTAGVATFSNISDTIGGKSVDGVIATINGSVFGGVNGVDNMVVKVATLAANDTDDRMLVVKYDSSGTIAWQKAIQLEAGYNCRGADADIDSNGNVYVCGNFDYDNNGDTNSAMIIIKFNFEGVKKWTRKVQGPCEDFASSIVVGPDDSLYLSAFTADAPAGPNTDYSMVVAKYNLDGTVAWQRVLDSISGSTTVGGSLFGPSNSGSTIAVGSGYVAVSGAFSSNFDESSIKAIVAQFDTDGKTFTVGDYDFKAATFTGLLNTTASNITVVNAGKTDSNYAGEFTVGDFEPTFNLASNLLGTVYRSINPGNELRNGNYFATLNANGSITLPAGGKISEAVVTSNPTIQLTPARPDVASQKLVIKGGGTYYFYDNNIEINYYSNILNVNDTLTIYVNSNTYANQTLYWWIYPENAGIGDSNSGSIALNSSGYGQFTILIDSDDYEFRVRVSPENGQYDPANVGVQSGLINSEAPAFDSDHHLHLTTGNLSETSIFLGTDNHNVRTTTDGGIQVTTQTTTVELPHTMTITGADVAAVNLVYTRDLTEITPTWTSPEVNPATDPYIVWSEADGEFGIIAPDIDPVTPVYVNTGTLAVPLAQWSTNPPLGSIPPLGVYTYLTPDVHAWQFGIDGATTFPTLTVPISDNATPSGTGQTIKFGDSSQQAIIFGPEALSPGSPSAQRVIIQGAPGYTGTAGEGGDVYVWAGPGGSTDGNGGDIKVRAGQGDGTGGGGYLNFQAGDSGTGNGGWINIESGQSNTYGNGGDITVQAHDGGEIFLRTHNGITTQTWTLGATGALTFPDTTVQTTAYTGLASNTTVAKDGPVFADIGKGEAATVTVSPTNNTNLTPGTVTGIVFGTGFTLDITVAVNGDISAVVTDSISNLSVGDVGTLVGGSPYFGGTGGTDNITFTVASLTNIIAATAIDLTKTINKLSEGVYTLADGVEGQIMYLVPTEGGVDIGQSDSVVINIPGKSRVSGRYTGQQYTSIGGNLNTFYPFKTVATPDVTGAADVYIDTNVCILIFTDDAWQAQGGSWAV